MRSMLVALSVVFAVLALASPCPAPIEIQHPGNTLPLVHHFEEPEWTQIQGDAWQDSAGLFEAIRITDSFCSGQFVPNRVTVWTNHDRDFFIDWCRCEENVIKIIRSDGPFQRTTPEAVISAFGQYDLFYYEVLFDEQGVKIYQNWTQIYWAQPEVDLD